MIPTDPREKYTTLIEKPKVYQRPSSGRGRKEVPDVTATLAFGDPNKTLSQPPADLGPLRHVSAPYIPTGMKNEFGQEIHNEAELARQQLAASGIAGLPNGEKDNILPDESSPSKGLAPRIETSENDRLLSSFQSGLAILGKAGIRHLMRSKNRAVPVLKQWASIVAVLSMVTPFNYMLGTEMPLESNLFDVNIIPSHIWFVACLLTGDSPTTTVFKTIIEKWQAIKQMLHDNEIDDVSGTAMIMSPLQEHARGAAKKYGWLLRMDQETRFNKQRLEGIELWMDMLHMDTKKFMRTWLKERDAELVKLLSQNEKLMASGEIEDEGDSEAKCYV